MCDGTNSLVLDTLCNDHQELFAQSNNKPSIASTSSSPDIEELQQDLEPDYQEVDDNRQSKYEPKSVRKKAAGNICGLGPPQIRIERRAFPRYRSSAQSSLSGGDDLFLDDSPNSDTLKSPPLFKTLPKNVHLNSWSLKKHGKDSPLSISNKSETAVIEQEKHDVKSQTSKTHDVHEYDDPPPPSPTAKTYNKPSIKPPTLTPVKSSATGQKSGVNSRRGTENEYKASLHEGTVYATPPPETDRHQTEMPFNHRNIPAFATMPRYKKHMVIGGNQSTTQGAVNKYYSNEGPMPLSRSFSERRCKPPTPPMRRMPSWENRIYCIAKTGLQVPDNESQCVRQSRVTVTEDDLYTDHISSELSVPVYTMLRGVSGACQVISQNVIELMHLINFIEELLTPSWFYIQPLFEQVPCAFN